MLEARRELDDFELAGFGDISEENKAKLKEVVYKARLAGMYIDIPCLLMFLNTHSAQTSKLDLLHNTGIQKLEYEEIEWKPKKQTFTRQNKNNIKNQNKFMKTKMRSR